MSGHSKWATIKRKKGAADARRGKLFSKLNRELATAARLGGGDPAANPRLRLVLDKARAANMPKDNIERAIAKGTGEAGGDAYEEVAYEGYGPGGVAVYVEALTDNRNRTVSEVRHVLGRYGGNLGASGCASHLFDKKGVLEFDREGLDVDALLEAALEAGAEDAVEGRDVVEVTTSPGDFEQVRRALVERGFEPAHGHVAMQPISTVKLEGPEARSMLSLADALEELDDVQNVYANFDISDEEMAQYA